MGQTREQRVIKQLSGTQKQTPIATDMFIPNHSGDLSVGNVNITPKNPKDPVNKEYVDSISINTGIDLFAYDDASDIATYKVLKPEPSVGSEVEGNVSIAGNASGQAVGARATELTCDCVKLINTLTAGVYNFHVHMRAATANRLTFYAEFYVRDSGGTETLIATSEETALIGTTGFGYDTHATVTEEYPLSTGDRIVVKGYAKNSSPAATTLYIAVEGDTATRISVRGISAPRMHDSLAHLKWSEAGHTIDSVFEIHNSSPFLSFKDTNGSGTSAQSTIVFQDMDNATLGTFGFTYPTNSDFYITATSGKIRLSGTSIYAGNMKITDLVNPTSDQDAATKKYVDDNDSDTTYTGGTNLTL
ncbi:MAG: hypothetical protein DRR06_15205, partial [Gammaproteobacteria bacterium]